MLAYLGKSTSGHALHLYMVIEGDLAITEIETSKDETRSDATKKEERWYSIEYRSRLVHNTHSQIDASFR